MRSYSHNSALITGTGTVVTGLGAALGNLLYWNSGLGGSAIFDLIYTIDPRPAPTGAPWIVQQTVTATHLLSGVIPLNLPAGYWATRINSVFSGGGNTGIVSTFFEMV